MKCLSCSSDLGKDQKFCTACGATVAAAAAEKFCTKCGAARDPADQFCVQCGSPPIPDHPPAITTSPSAPAPPAGDKTLIKSVPVAERPAPVEQLPLKAIEKKAIPRAAPPSIAPNAVPAKPIESPKKSNGKLLGIAAVIVVVVGGWLLMSGKKPALAPVPDLPQAAPKTDSNPAQAPASVIKPATGWMLVEAAVQGDAKAFELILEQIKQAPGPDAGDNKIARKLNEAALMALREKNYAQAVEVLEKANTADPADIEISTNLGYALHMAERYQEAEKRLIQVIEQNPERAEAWGNLATTSSKLGKSRQAVAAYITAYNLHTKPERLLESLKKTVDSSEDEAVRKDILEAVQRIEAKR